LPDFPPPPKHAKTHEIDGRDLVRPYLPLTGTWRVSGTVAPFVFEGDSVDELYVEGILYFDEDEGKVKVE